MTELITPGMVLLFVSSVAGTFAHYVNLRLRGDTKVGPIGYLIETPGFTIATFIALIAADLGLVAVGQIENSTPHVIAALGFTTGWALDSGIAARCHHDEDNEHNHGDTDGTS
jgi:hypothetical protein